MLITDSEYIRQEVASRFGWPLGKTRAIPLACSPDFRLRTSEEVWPVLEMHGLRPWSRSLFVGTIEPRKNLDALLLGEKLAAAASPGILEYLAIPVF